MRVNRLVTAAIVFLLFIDVKTSTMTYIRYCAFHAFTIVHLPVFASCVHPLNCSFEEYTESIQEFIGIQGLHFVQDLRQI